MPEDVIKARVIFDTSGIGGSLGGGGPSASTGGKNSIGDIAKGVFAGNAILDGIKKGVKSMAGAVVQASPRLQAQLQVFQKGLFLLLRPIGDVLSMWLKPFIMRFLHYGMKFYQDYKDGGFWYAFGEAIKGIPDVIFGEDATFWDKVKGTMEIAAVLALAKVGFGAIAKAFGLETIASDDGSLALSIPGIIAIGSILGAAAIAGFIKAIGDALAAEFGAGQRLSDEIDIEGGQQAVREYAEKDIMKGKGTVQMFKNETTGKWNLKPTTFESISHEISKHEVPPMGGLKGRDDYDYGYNESMLLTKNLKGDTIKDTEETVEESKGIWQTLWDWLKGMFYGDGGEGAEGDAVVDMPGAMSKGFQDEAPILQKSFDDTFTTGLIQNNLTPSKQYATDLYNEVMKLNTTVTTTHVIVTKRVEIDND